MDASPVVVFKVDFEIPLGTFLRRGGGVEDSQVVVFKVDFENPSEKWMKGEFGVFFIFVIKGYLEIPSGYIFVRSEDLVFQT